MSDYATIRIGKLPGKINDVALNGDRSVRAALEAAELDPQGYEIRVNGSVATMEMDLGDGDTVLLVKKIKGNRS